MPVFDVGMYFVVTLPTQRNYMPVGLAVSRITSVEVVEVDDALAAMAFLAATFVTFVVAGAERDPMVAAVVRVID